MTSMKEAIALVIAADDAFDPDKGGTQYALLDTAIEAVRAALSQPSLTHALLDEAARQIVAWGDTDRVDSDDADWVGYDAALAACRSAVEEC